MSFVYNNGASLVSASYWTGTTVKAILVTAGYVADRDHVFVSAIGANELSGTGYVAGFGGAGRKTLAGKTATVDNVNNLTAYGATNPVWTAITAGTAAAIIIIQEITNDAASVLLAYLDAATPRATSGLDLTGGFAGGLCFTATT